MHCLQGQRMTNIILVRNPVGTIVTHNHNFMIIMAYPRQRIIDGRVLKIRSHHHLNFTNEVTITEYFLSTLKFACEHAKRNSEYSHTLASDRQVLNIFGQGKSKDE